MIEVIKLLSVSRSILIANVIFNSEEIPDSLQKFWICDIITFRFAALKRRFTSESARCSG